MESINKPIAFLSLLLFLLGTSCTKMFIGDEGEADEDIYLNYESKTKLSLPFEGEWYIVNGGITHEDGAHHFVTRGWGQRYAFDSYIKRNGKSHSGNGKNNEDYYCFGATLLAPAAGKVIAVENSEDDLIPGESFEGDNALGNHVIIDHLNGEYSFLAHFKKGSITVAVGTHVVKGDVLGQAGNSGNSTEPHLHYHLQNTANKMDGMGLPAKFHQYYANGKLFVRGLPTKGQRVTNE